MSQQKNIALLIHKMDQQLLDALFIQSWTKIEHLSIQTNTLLKFIYQNPDSILKYKNELLSLRDTLENVYQKTQMAADQTSGLLKNMRENKEGLLAYQEAEYHDNH